VPDDIQRQLPDEVVDELLADARTEREIVGPGGLLSQLTKRLVERALEAFEARWGQQLPVIGQA
jgi:hypothetical protein